MKRVLLCALLSASGAEAQKPPERPGFGASVSAVAIDVSALDAEGRPVPDLRPDEFVVTLDGRPQRVVSARFRSHTASAAAQEPELERPFSSNEAYAPGRVLVIVVDRVGLGSGTSRVLQAFGEQFIGLLGPRDVAMLATLPGPATRVQYTSEHARVRDALASIAGFQRLVSPRLYLPEALAFAQSDPYWREVTDRECPEGRAQSSVVMARMCILNLESEARAVLEAFKSETISVVDGLRGLVGMLREKPGPKRVVLLTAGFGDQGGSELPRLVQEAEAARASLHVILLDEGRADVALARISRRSSDERSARTAGPERLSGLARSSLLRVFGSVDGAVLRLVDELSGDYALGFEVQDVAAGNQAHEVRVAVTRPGVSAKTWGRIRLPGSVAVARQPEEALATVLRTRALQTDLPVKVTTYALREPPGGQTRVVVAAEIGGPHAMPAATAVAFVLLDAAGRVAASSYRPPLDAPADGPASYLGSAEVAPGDYLLRLAVLDDKGRVGSVEHRVRATVAEAGALEVGDLILAAAGGAGAASKPSVDLTLRGTDLVSYLELYAGDRQVLDGASVRFEVVGRDGEGAALLEASAEARAGSEGRRRVERTLGAGQLPPGEYLARAAVAVAGETVWRLSRPFRVAEPGSLASTSPGPISFDDIAPALPRFDPASVLAPELLLPALDQLGSRARGKAAGPALEKARAGRFDELAELADGDPLSAPFLRGLGLYARGESQAAATEFRSALRAASDFLPAAFYLGACYAAQEKDLEAAGAWQTSLIGGGGATVHRLIAEALLRGRDAPRALEALQESGLVEGTAQRALGLAYALTGRRGESLEALGAYLDSRPDDLATLFLATKLLFDEYAARGSEFRERERLERYARAYLAAGGERKALVARWIAQLEAS